MGAHLKQLVGPIADGARARSSTSASGASVAARPRARSTLVLITLAVASILVLAVVAAKGRGAWLELHPAVPSLLGRTVDEAAQMIIPLHFVVNVTGYRQDPAAPFGVILAQDPLPGQSLLVRSSIQLTVSRGSGVVPILRGGAVSSAIRRLEMVGLRLGRVSYIYDDAAKDTVLEQSAPPGTQLATNNPVDVLLSDGPAPSLAVGPVPPADLPATHHVVPRREAAKRSHVGPNERSEYAGPIHPERSTDAQCERPQVCTQSTHDRGAQPNVHGPEHRGQLAGP
jgi:hypothetical protein